MFAYSENDNRAFIMSFIAIGLMTSSICDANANEAFGQCSRTNYESNYIQASSVATYSNDIRNINDSFFMSFANKIEETPSEVLDSLNRYFWDILA